MVDLSNEADAWWNNTPWKMVNFTPGHISIECEMHVHNPEEGDCEYYEVVGVVPDSDANDIAFAHNQVLERLLNNVATLRSALSDLLRSVDVKASEVVYRCHDDANDLTDYIRAAKDALKTVDA